MPWTEKDKKELLKSWGDYLSYLRSISLDTARKETVIGRLEQLHKKCTKSWEKTEESASRTLRDMVLSCVLSQNDYAKEIGMCFDLISISDKITRVDTEQLGKYDRKLEEYKQELRRGEMDKGAYEFLAKEIELDRKKALPKRDAAVRKLEAEMWKSLEKLCPNPGNYITNGHLDVKKIFNEVKSGCIKGTENAIKAFEKLVPDKE